MSKVGSPTIGKRLDYEKRMNLVLDHLYSNLDAQLDLNHLADIACMSPYHWHRVYQAMHGETIAATVKRLRLQRAADMLANTKQSIDAIARRASYSGAPSFSRAFKADYGMPPVQYRQAGGHAEFVAAMEAQTSCEFDVEIRQMPAIQCVGVAHSGSYMKIDKAFTQLFTILGRENAIGAQTQMYGVYFDDPGLLAEAQLDSLACATSIADIDVQAPLERYEIAGNTCAVLRHKGPYVDMRFAYQWLYGQWLVNSVYEVADSPVYEAYLNNPRDTLPTELLVDIYLPLAI